MTIQPIVFTLLFLYVLGSAIHIPGVRYQDYLLPGLIGQGLAFGLIGAGVATATDFASGVVDRFRSLPVTRLSVISAQVIGQMIEQILGMLIIAGMGLALGWRPHLSPYGFFELVRPRPPRVVRIHLGGCALGHARSQFGRHAGHRIRPCLPALFPRRDIRPDLGNEGGSEGNW